MVNNSVNEFSEDDTGFLTAAMDYSDILVGLQNDTMLYSEDYYDISSRAVHIFGQVDKIVALIIAFVALLANIASLLAIRYTYGDLSPHQRLMISLALSDMFISASVILHIVNHILNPVYQFNAANNLRLQAHCTRVLIEGLNRTSHVISLMNLMGMAADHYMAILKPLDYHRLMSKKRSRIMILVLWIVSAIFGFSDLFSGFAGYDRSSEKRYSYTSNYCEIIRYNNFHPEFAIFTLVIVCFIVMSAIYSKIFLIVRSHQRRAKEVKENRKAVVTTLLILVTFAVCFLPNTLFQTIMIILVHYTKETLSASLYYINQYLYILMLLNSILDPVIYATRMREVRLGYAVLLKKMFNKCRRKQTPFIHNYTQVETRNTFSTSKGNNRFSLSYNLTEATHMSVFLDHHVRRTSSMDPSGIHRDSVAGRKHSQSVVKNTVKK